MIKQTKQQDRPSGVRQITEEIECAHENIAIRQTMKQIGLNQYRDSAHAEGDAGKDIKPQFFFGLNQNRSRNESEKQDMHDG